jgi:prolyl-tRNA editing enzyme YbaK/EbsC (Cys-tRNA(Pro) deacylase)
MSDTHTPETLSPSAQKVQDVLKARGYSNEVIEFAQTTRTSAEAAAAIGTTVAQIAKSLNFKTKHTHRAILVIASGINRVNEKKLAALVGEVIERPDADFVRAQTGFAIGGVPPIGHVAALDTWVDEDLRAFDTIWAAAGTSFAVFKLTPTELIAMTGGHIVTIK